MAGSRMTPEHGACADNCVQLVRWWERNRPDEQPPHVVAHQLSDGGRVTFHLRGNPEHLAAILDALRRLHGLAQLFRRCADGRREQIRGVEGDNRYAGMAEGLRLEAETLDAVARVIEGDRGPLYNWLPSWRWTEDMNRALFARGEDSTGER